jgi:hypothetical protein
LIVALPPKGSLRRAKHKQIDWRACDAGKKIKGKKRHTDDETIGLLINPAVTMCTIAR